jgi:glutaminase
MLRKVIGIMEARLASPNLNSSASATADFNIVFTIQQISKLAELLAKAKAEGEGDYTIRVQREPDNSKRHRRLTVTFLPPSH